MYEGTEKERGNIDFFAQKAWSVTQFFAAVFILFFNFWSRSHLEFLCSVSHYRMDRFCEQLCKHKVFSYVLL